MRNLKNIQIEAVGTEEPEAGNLPPNQTIFFRTALE